MNIQAISQNVHHETFIKDPLTGVVYTSYLQAIADRNLESWINMFDSRIEFQRILVMACHSVYEFQQYGQQVFHLSHDIAWMLNMTKLPKLPIDSINFPYPGFYVQIPESMNLLLHAGPDELDSDRIIGAYVSDFQVIRENSRDVPGDKPRVMFHIITKKLDGSPGFGNFNFMLSHHRDDLEEYLKDFSPDFNKPDSVQAVLRIVLNLLFYLNATNAETVKHDNSEEIKEIKVRLKNKKMKDRKRSKLQKRLNLLSNKAVITVVAPSVKLNYSPGDPTGIKVRRHWVRGHDHHYWVGTGDDRKLVLYWVKPFERGDTVAEAVRDRYEVK